MNWLRAEVKMERWEVAALWGAQVIVALHIIAKSDLAEAFMRGFNG
jgi:hypothetical protein